MATKLRKIISPRCQGISRRRLAVCQNIQFRVSWPDGPRSRSRCSELRACPHKYAAHFSSSQAPSWLSCFPLFSSVAVATAPFTPRMDSSNNTFPTSGSSHAHSKTLQSEVLAPLLGGRLSHTPPYAPSSPCILFTPINMSKLLAVSESGARKPRAFSHAILPLIGRGIPFSAWNETDAVLRPAPAAGGEQKIQEKRKNRLPREVGKIAKAETHFRPLPVPVPLANALWPSHTRSHTRPASMLMAAIKHWSRP